MKNLDCVPGFVNGIGCFDEFLRIKCGLYPNPIRFVYSLGQQNMLSRLWIIQETTIKYLLSIILMFEFIWSTMNQEKKNQESTPGQANTINRVAGKILVNTMTFFLWLIDASLIYMVDTRRGNIWGGKNIYKEISLCLKSLSASRRADLWPTANSECAGVECLAGRQGMRGCIEIYLRIVRWFLFPKDKLFGKSFIILWKYHISINHFHFDFISFLFNGWYDGMDGFPG